MFPFWTLGIPGRIKTIKEGKILTEQINNASKAQQALINTARDIRKLKPGIILPGTLAAGTGLVASKVAADSMTNTKNIAPTASNSLTTALEMTQRYPYSYMGGRGVTGFNRASRGTANFFAFNLLAGIENGLATTVHAMRNANLKKRLADLTTNNELITAAIEKERANNFKDVPLKLAGVGLGTAAIATPAFVYMNNRKKNKNNKNNPSNIPTQANQLEGLM